MQKTIFDIGAHTGKDSLFYLLKGFKVIGVEANPELVKELKITLKKYIDSGDYILIDKALSNSNVACIKFYINNVQTDWGTLFNKWNRSMSNTFEEIEVEAITAEQLINTYGIPYYMKIDIEGSDVMVLDTLLELKQKPLYLSIELLTPDNWDSRNVDYLEILRKVKLLGYTKFIISDQSKHGISGGQLSPPCPSLEGEYVQYSFDGQTSGLFGKEIFGTHKQIDYELIIEKYSSYFTTGINNDIFHNNGWFDMHCTY